MSLVDIEKEFIEIFGETHFENLKKWYLDIIQQPCRYLVFMGNRCYNLGCLLEKVTEVILTDEEEKEVLTESSFFLRCDEMAYYFTENGYFPSIILCDFKIIHGRSLNSYIKSLQLQFYDLLPNVSREVIDDNLVRAIQLRVYARVDNALLLNNKYEMKLKKQCVLETRKMHWLSYALSSLLVRFNSFNNMYILSEFIDNEQYSNIDKKDAIFTKYQNVSQYVWIEFLGIDNEKKGIGTIRIAFDKRTDGYRVIPLVLLPNLSNDETDRLYKVIRYKLEENKFDTDYLVWLDKIVSYKGKRMFNEFITLLFSYSFLNRFNEINNIKYDNLVLEDDLRNLVRNYNCFGEKRTYEFLSRIIIENIISWEEIKNLISAVVSKDRKIIYVTGNDKTDISEVEKENIKSYIEDKYYELVELKEKSAYESNLSLNKYMEERDNRQIYGNGFMLRKILHEFNEVEIKYSISYFLHMLNLGMLSLSSNTSNNISVVGFAQFIEPCEILQLVWSLRVYEWIPLMTFIEQECNWEHKEFKKVLQDFSIKENDYLDSEIVKKILYFKSLLDAYGEKADDWYFRVFLRLDNCNNKEIIDFLTLQQNHIDRYNKFKKGN